MFIAFLYLFIIGIFLLWVVIGVNEMVSVHNVYILGSKNQLDQITRFIKTINDDVKIDYTKNDPSMSLRETIAERFEKIKRADIIYVMVEGNGSIREEILYELEYAERLNKNIIYVNSTDIYSKLP